ncbi:MAG: PA2169 family four-helix-bundle protein [Acidobacteria bacterium]|nr:PA2169 family four-helix-bundle protein [Acidobacteriota bacterium]
MNNNEVISILNGLIETCKDGQEGFRTAAENIRNSEFRRLFNIFSQQRAQFVTELQSEVHRLGGDPERSGSVAGSLHRGWMNVKSMVSRTDEAGIIAECQRGEETAVDAYQEALKADLPLDVQYVVKRQYMDIKDAYDRIRILQRAA